MNYEELFSDAFGRDGERAIAPFDYQRQIAEGDWPDLLDVPTGMGKTAAVTLAWLWKRGWRIGKREFGPDIRTPRRLVYCLPMRVLVEQTYESISGWLQRLDLGGAPGEGKVSAHVLMGGADDTDTWAEHPEEDMILIGTQDMLLSRALMRGYGMSRYAWPVHFALLHNDALWVFDEVQLMGAGLPTSAQLEALRRTFPLGRPSRSLWLSATLSSDWLATVDMKPHIASLKRRAISTSDQEQAADRLRAIKSVAAASVELGPDSTSKKGKSDYIESLCDIVLSEHDETAQTLVILNRVDRAQDLYRLLRAQRAGKRDLLIHSRFRPKERAEQSRFLREEPTTDRIVISTQAIEAGVDISSRVLITELAPWSSLVQRFGRCNRYGEHNDTGGARILWIDVADDSEVALPYSCDQLANAREKIKAIKEASPRNLPATDEARPLTSVLRRKDMLELFNTDPDLSGFDVDVSDYIRDSGVPGVQVFWRDFERDPQSPTPQSRPQRAELCPISIGQSKGLQKRGAWYWDSLDGEWRRLDRDARPGMTLMLRAADGGYGPVVGFDSALKKAVPVIVQETRNPTEREFGDDRRSTARIPVMLLDHLANVAKHARDLCAAVGEEGNVAEVVRASRWHDVGKAHEVFHETMHSCAEAPDGLLAKSPCAGRHKRKFFRHEVASMLAWLGNNNWESQGDLIAYLIVAHHGKVRMSLRAMPTEKPAPDGRRFARGVWEGDTLPALSFDGERCAETALRLALMEMGEGEHGPSWAARTLKLLGEYGPFRLAWLESLVRMADWRASAAEQQQQGFRHGQ